VNNAKNPNTNTNGVLNLRLPPYKVANHENILIPVGTAITIVAAVKYALVKQFGQYLNLTKMLNFSRACL